MKPSTAIAKLLLELGAVNLRPDEPFKYSSGILSPIYTDNRVLISYPDARKKISIALEELARTNLRDIEAVAGTATAGIPWAAWVAAEFNLPMVYVRSKAKSHGQQNQIEGVLDGGARTVVVEDLISTGGSCLNAADAVRTAGAEPLAVIAIFTYGMKTARDGFAAKDLPLYTLTDFETLVGVALQEGRITDESHAKVLEWAADPAEWGKKMGFE